MREYRGIAADGRWVYGLLDALPDPQIRSKDGSVYLVDPKTIGQDTGEADKNGVRIFEHDYVRDVNNRVVRVIFAHGAFQLDYEAFTVPLCNVVVRRLEVVKKQQGGNDEKQILQGLR